MRGNLLKRLVVILGNRFCGTVGVSTVLLLLALCGGVSLLHAANPPRLNDPEAGKKLAEQIITQSPTESATFRGAFEMEQRDRDDDLVVPFAMSLRVDEGEWRSMYSARTPQGEEKLVILHRGNKPSVYTHTLPRREPVSLVGGRATNHFAGTDFSLLDLGLEFFHWPSQVLLTREMRKGRGCDVLESRPDQVGLYSKVISWIDQETGGILIADAYDASGKLWKQFEVRGFKKVAGQWQVEEMEIRNRHTKGSTRLRFVFDAK